ncbi:hypothetical protein Mapa_014008 [Marchantia paleacea]|nr:hypothetical protein Mapa_014008 [Marchantia paleacea]
MAACISGPGVSRIVPLATSLRFDKFGTRRTTFVRRCGEEMGEPGENSNKVEVSREEASQSQDKQSAPGAVKITSDAFNCQPGTINPSHETDERRIVDDNVYAFYRPSQKTPTEGNDSVGPVSDPAAAFDTFCRSESQWNEYEGRRRKHYLPEDVPEKKSE